MRREGKVKKKILPMKRAAKKTQKKVKGQDTQASSQVNLRVAISQMNSVVGDFKHNANCIKKSLKEAAKFGVDLILFPELTLTGYPPEDLLLKDDFITKNQKTLKNLALGVKGIVAVVGYVEKVKRSLYNSAALLYRGKVIGNYRKMILPNYGVFDEKRYFVEGDEPTCFVMNGIKIGLTICEDIWDVNGPGKQICEDGQADILLNISSSPYFKGKGKARENMIRQRARQYKAHIVYANLIGGQDELVFDGHSLVVAPDGTFVTKGNAFEEEMIYADLKISPKTEKQGLKKSINASIRTYYIPTILNRVSKPVILKRQIRRIESIEEIFKALVLGTRDYMKKNGFGKAAIGLSGGIDSALTAVIAVKAIGAKNVVGITMPSNYSSRGSVDDSEALANNLGISMVSLPIKKAMLAYDKILSKVFKNLPVDTTEENLQARIRGNLMMALSNKMGWLVLTTGNKSEFSVGYCTLYGDMAGGFAVIKDVPKIWVYRLSEWINKNEGNCLIPEKIILKEPSAELRPGQKDTDSLPPYSLLDKVLTRYIEEDKGIEGLRGVGLPMKEIKKIVKLVDKSEYKRRQGPPGIKITPKAFGKDRRLPITNCYEP
jgi:NAD+ synthase (glutamine-hydrolysing)